MGTALLLIDIQRDYFPGGRMEVEGCKTAARNAAAVLDHFRRMKLPVVHIRHLSLRPGATFFIPGTDGIDIDPSVQPLDGEPVIDKHYPNSFRETGLLELLQRTGARNLTICGMMTQMCIDATVRAAFDLEFTCTVIHDACAARPLAFGTIRVPAAEVHASFLAALAAVYARLVSAGDFLAAADQGGGP